IKLIEDYNLYLLDTMHPILEPMKSIASGRSIPNHVKKAASPEPRIYRRNRIEYCVVQPGDNVKKLTEQYSMFKREIRRFNEMGKDEEVTAGQEIYLQPKRKKAESGYTTHTVEAGENMHSISQIYGIKLKWLYKRNRMEMGTEPKVGQVVWLRGKKPAKK
ncbi:MAG: LysM domain-containing protein, partial [Bacteroidales bacterium]|nr:LysM domain-containing protein [Bacteroidales bacterium]